MKTIKLRTGVIITQDEDENVIHIESPYSKSKPFKLTILRYLKWQIKKIIKN